MIILQWLIVRYMKQNKLNLQSKFRYTFIKNCYLKIRHSIILYDTILTVQDVFAGANAKYAKIFYGRVVWPITQSFGCICIIRFEVTIIVV